MRECGYARAGSCKDSLLLLCLAQAGWIGRLGARGRDLEALRVHRLQLDARAVRLHQVPRDVCKHFLHTFPRFARRAVRRRHQVVTLLTEINTLLLN
jgi:hypothetical protein